MLRIQIPEKANHIISVLAEAGFEVCGFDVNQKTIETLQGGHIHNVEPGLQQA